MAEEKKIEVVEEISQAEGIEKRVAEAVRAAREAWQADMERQIDRAREEAEALARMSGEERMAHELSQRAAELDARECLSCPHKDDLVVSIGGQLA